MIIDAFSNCDLELMLTEPTGSERRNFPAAILYGRHHIHERDSRKPFQKSGTHVVKVDVNVRPKRSLAEASLSRKFSQIWGTENYPGRCTSAVAGPAAALRCFEQSIAHLGVYLLRLKLDPGNHSPQPWVALRHTPCSPQQDAKMIVPVDPSPKIHPTYCIPTW